MKTRNGIYVVSSMDAVHPQIVGQTTTQEQAILDERMRSFLISEDHYSFERSPYSQVMSFFDEGSRCFDRKLDEHLYWSFAHEILMFILRKFITEHFPDPGKIKVFDAGAGTGNWSRFVLSLNDRIQGTMFDMNSNMLRVAHKKLMRLLGNAVRIIEGNLEELSDFPSERANLLLCMHNVIGLARHTEVVLRNLFLHLDEGGIAFIMATNKYHAFNFACRFRSEVEIQRILRDQTVKFKDDMPEMFCYTPQEFRTILLTAGFEEVTVLGFPVTIYPPPVGMTLPQPIAPDTRLSDPASRAFLLEVEKKLCLDPELAYRAGSSLVAVCKKFEKHE